MKNREDQEQEQPELLGPETPVPTTRSCGVVAADAATAAPLPDPDGIIRKYLDNEVFEVDPNQPYHLRGPLVISNAHRMIMYMVLDGMRISEIAAKISCSPQTVRILINAPMFRFELRRMEKRIEARALDAVSRFHALAPQAVNAVKEILTTPDGVGAAKPADRLKAAKLALDYGGFKPAERSTVDVNVSVSSVHARTVEAAWARRAQTLGLPAPRAAVPVAQPQPRVIPTQTIVREDRSAQPSTPSAEDELAEAELASFAREAGASDPTHFRSFADMDDPADPCVRDPLTSEIYTPDSFLSNADAEALFGLVAKGEDSDRVLTQMHVPVDTCTATAAPELRPEHIAIPGDPLREVIAAEEEERQTRNERKKSKAAA